MELGKEGEEIRHQRGTGAAHVAEWLVNCCLLVAGRCLLSVDCRLVFVESMKTTVRGSVKIEATHVAIGRRKRITAKRKRNRRVN